MKRTLFVLVLAVVLALTFATIATAKYAGYAYNNPILDAESDSVENPFPGYLSWSGALAIYDHNNPGGTDMAGAHGGYVTTTTKCAVCHSAHRASSAAATDATHPAVNNSLTSVASCVNCHTVWGAGSATKKIEWENLLTTTSADPGGPHHHADPTCTNKCHTGGIHGGVASAYNGMNNYMLGNDKDAALTAAFAAGNTSPNIVYNTSSANGAGWFRNGTTRTPSMGEMPAGVNRGQLAAAKAMATGYTCAQSGCHTSSQFAVNNWGFAENHVADPRHSNPASFPTPETLPFTGHVTGDFNDRGPDCGPCHPGGAAGGYRMTPTSENLSAAQYGCDQCHDMVGKLTNSTAWPHGNRAIDVWEWEEDGTQITREAIDLPSGNLWMYQSDMAAITHGQNAALDKSFKVVQDTIFHGTAVGNINDGVCLKCHVPTDDASREARGIAPSATMNAGQHWYSPTSTSGSKVIFLWK